MPLKGLVPRIFRLSLKVKDIPRNAMVACVVIGYSEKHARTLASNNCGVEGQAYWVKSLYSDCVQIGSPDPTHNYPQFLCSQIG